MHLFRNTICALALTLASATFAATPAVNNDDSETFYLQLVSSSRMGRAEASAPVRVEAGKQFLTLTDAGEAMRISLSRLRFPSLIDALNYLASNGWRLSQTYTAGSGPQSTVVWVIEKTVTDRAQLLDGLSGVDN